MKHIHIRDRDGPGEHNDVRVDYTHYEYSITEIITYLIMGGVIGLMLMYLFYSDIFISIIGAIISAFIYLHVNNKRLCEKRKRELSLQFRDALNSISTALVAGYSMENSIAEAIRDLKLLYNDDTAIIIRELSDIKMRVELGVPLHKLLYELGTRSGVSDIIIFSEVYNTARKSGGNLVKVIHRTSDTISEKIDIEKEVQTMISGKKLESICMSVIPLLIIAYLRVFSKGFLDPLYHGIAGRLMMSVALIVYIFSVWWSLRIMNIRY